MAFKFGETREDREREEAKRIQELENEVRERNSRKQEKLAQLTRKNKTNKIIVIAISSILLLSLLTFGIYNTFIKKPISEDEIRAIAAQYAYSEFNNKGLQGFLVNNMEPKIKENISLPDNVESIEIDKNTIVINNITQLDYKTAIVYFSTDITIKDKDTEVTNKEGKKEKVVGKTYTKPYQFRVAVSVDNNVYSIGSEILLVENPNIYMDGESGLVSYFAFINDDGTEITKDDEETILTKRTKVDRILADIYGGKAVGSDFESKRLIPTQGYTYGGIVNFISYTDFNKMGANAICTFYVTTTEGFTYTNTYMMRIEQNGQSYKIVDCI